MKLTGARHFVTRTIWFAIIAALLCTAAVAAQPVQATSTGELTGPGWIYVVTQEGETVGADYYQYDALYAINTYTNEKLGPFLRDELSTLDETTGFPVGQDLFDVAVTPDGKTLLVSSFSKKLVHFVDVSIPWKPVYLGSLHLDIMAEDIAITADGKYAIVTDGGFTQSMYSIDIANRVVKYELLMPTIAHDKGGDPIYGYTNAVAIAPDGTVVVADYSNGFIHSVYIGPQGTLTYIGSYHYFVSTDGEFSTDPLVLTTSISPRTTNAGLVPDTSQLDPLPATTGANSASGLTTAVKWQPIRPVNVSIAPDGVTVLVSDSANYVDTSLPSYSAQYDVGVYKIIDPGELELVDVIFGLDHAMQNITFTEDSSKAIMLGNNAHTYDSTADPTDTSPNDRVYILNLTPNGSGTYDYQSVELEQYTSSQLFGVDTIAYYEGKIYASYPTLMIDTDEFPTRYVSVIDMETLERTLIDWGASTDNVPVGLAARQFVPFKSWFPFVPVRSR